VQGKLRSKDQQVETVSNSDLDAIRTRLEGKSGREYWNELEALYGTAAFQSYLQSEFPAVAGRLQQGLERRSFLRLMGASLGLAGVAACTRQPEEKILPAAANPEYTIPGKPRYFATAMTLGGASMGLLVESHMGRPTKVEGNPDHPASLGASNAFAQSSILSLYDPDRSHSIRRNDGISTWSSFLDELETRMNGLRPRQGDGLAILVGDLASPTLTHQLERLQARLQKARIHRWTPIHDDTARAGARLAFGREVSTRYSFDQAEVVVSLDADFLDSGPASVRYARDFSSARRPRQGGHEMNYLVSVDSSTSVTAAMADDRLPVKPSEVELFARALASELGLPVEAPRIESRVRNFAAKVARRLTEAEGRSLVVPGETQSAAVHAIAHAANAHLGNVGATVEHAAPLEPSENGLGGAHESIRSLVDDLRGGMIDTLIVLGGNPVYDAPADLDFEAALASAPFRVHLSLNVNETSQACQWHLPMAHFLESWSDARAYDGTASIVQPLIAPLFRGRSAHELVATLMDPNGARAYELVRDYWRQALPHTSDEAFERFWQTALHDGVIPDSRFPALELRLLPLDLPAPPRVPTGLELSFRADASTYDGRFANNGWLQEAPRPLTRITWDNALLIAPSNARDLDLESGDVVVISAGEREIEAPVWVTPGQPEGSLTVQLGYGRRLAGELGTGVGFDAYKLRSSYGPWMCAGVQLRRTGETHALASVQDHARMEGRNLVHVKTFDRFGAHREEEQHGSDHGDLSMYPPYPYEGNAWGMVIDLNACIGCSACLVACQAENNVPIVGKEEVLRGREMHWMRIDRYYEDREGEDETNPLVLNQPVPCMQCEEAPCEVVCPVGATVHSDEGLNDMVYNRCVGTRYCANNCPYKVRRFNYFRYADYEPESLKLARNPDVTVRHRGVMEKCTYCVQRISQGRIDAKKEGREIRDGEVRSACQQACPTQAIAFGNLNDPSSEVAKLRKEPDHYALLGELGTKPRTTYLAKFVNPSSQA